MLAEEKEVVAKTENGAKDISLDPRHFLQVETRALPQISADFVETLEDGNGKSFVFGGLLFLLILVLSRRIVLKLKKC